MRSLYTALIHVREPNPLQVRAMVEPMLRSCYGVHDVHFEPAEALIAVEFDRLQTNLAELVRLIEDGGTAVSSVAQRRREWRQAG